MEWSRVKSIMIGVFCIINIFLLASYMGSMRTAVSISEDTVSNTVEILRNNNVLIDSALIPRKTQDIRTFDVKNKYANHKAAAEGFWQAAQAEGLDFFNPQRVKFDGKSFEYTAPSGQERISGLNKKKAEAYVKKLASRLNLASAVSVEAVTAEANGGYTVTLYQIYDGNKVLDKFLLFELNENGISRIYGENWLCDETEGGGISPVRPVSEILVSFAVGADRTSATQIIDVRLGYFIGARDSIKKTEAVPVWRITTDIGSSFYFDARNGDLL